MPDTVDILLPSEKGAPLTRAEGEAQWQKVEDAVTPFFSNGDNCVVRFRVTETSSRTTWVVGQSFIELSFSNLYVG